MREHASWDPTAYARFAGERSRPFADLVAQVRTDDPTLVVDLGYGALPVTIATWPGPMKPSRNPAGGSMKGRSRSMWRASCTAASSSRQPAQPSRWARAAPN